VLNKGTKGRGGLPFLNDGFKAVYLRKYFKVSILSKLDESAQNWLHRVCLLVVFYLCIFFNGYTQASPYFIRFSTAEGLPSNITEDLVSDAEGFVWVGTRSGLARFDGQHFVSFRHLSPSSALPEEHVLGLLADRRGYLWTKFSKKLYRISLTTFKAELMTESWSPQCEDEAGNVYFTCPDGLAVFREKQGGFERLPMVFQGEKLEVWWVHRGKDGQLLVGSSAGIFRFNTQQKTYFRLNALDGATNLLTAKVDEEGMLWISKWNSPENGLIRYDPYVDQILHTFSAGKNGLSSTDLNDICMDGTQVWLATNAGGLCRYAIQEDRFYVYSAASGTPGHLWSNQVSRILKDHFGNLWVSSPFFLFQVPAKRITTGLLSHDPDNPNSLIDPHCGSMAAISDDLMAFGTLNGISIFERKKHRFLNIKLPAYSDYNNHVTSLAKAEQGGFWASTWTGLYRLEAHSGRILEYFITSNNSKAIHLEAVKRQHVGSIRRICKDHNGVLWIVNFSNRLVRLDEKDPVRTFVSMDTLVVDTIPLNDRVEAFLDYDERYLLLGTLDGLVRYDRSTQRFESYPVVYGGIKSPVRIESLARSHNGTVFCIANGKLFRLQLGATSATAMPLPTSSEVLQGQHILEDRFNNQWVSTENGVMLINEVTASALFYDSRNYLNDNILLLRPSVIPAQDADGYLYFGGARGVSVLNPTDFKAVQSQLPIVKIIDLNINGQPANLDSAIHRLTVLQLPYNQNNLSFAFTILYSAVPERNCYAYRINGGKWVYLGTKNMVNFSRLAPGDYDLQVKAANSDGVWNEEGTQLYISILPPWWRSWPAYLTYLLLLGLLLRRYLRFREKRLQLAHQLDTERKEAERMHELDDFKSRFFTNISHEFRTPLTVILGMAEQISETANSNDQLSQHIALIQRNGQNLLRLINQILDLAKLESGKLSVQLEQADMVAFSRYIVESLQLLSKIKDISLHFEAETNDLWMAFDVEKMQSVLFNLLSNAIKFTPKGGHIYLKITHETADNQSICRISVRDTGVGIPEEKLERIFDRFYRVDESYTRQADGTGIGLAFTRELVRLMGGSIAVKSQLGEGTSFEVVLPIRELPQETASLHTPTWGISRNPDVKQDIVPVASFFEEGNFANANAELLPNENSQVLKPVLLIVEDNDDVRQYLRACVVEQYHVIEACNGRAGIEMALEHTPDLIVSDVMMPEKDGLELCQTLKNDPRTSHIPIVLLTAKASVESRIAGLSRGGDAYLTKPFHREELVLILGNLLQSRRVLQERIKATLLASQAAIDTSSVTAAVALEPLTVLEIEDVFVQKLRQYTEENLSNANLSMEELSRAMTMSYQNLHRKLTALTNLSPVQFIRFIRLQKAKVLLQTTQLSVGDIAFEVGFSDPKYFSRVFTEEFGKPPSTMRFEAG
jgi:signal transduction histidine kinase/DNA-binding response OmpR family regulator